MAKKKPLTHCLFCGGALPDRYKGRSRSYCNITCRTKYQKLKKNTN